MKLSLVFSPIFVISSLISICNGQGDGADGACDDTFADFSECTVQSVTVCKGCDAVPGPGLTPGNCDGFSEWSGKNKGCCDSDECSSQFNAFTDCMGCSSSGEAELEPGVPGDSACGQCVKDPAANCEDICLGTEGEVEPDSACAECVVDPTANCEAVCLGAEGEVEPDSACGQCVKDPAANCEDICLGTEGEVDPDSACAECVSSPGSNCEAACLGMEAEVNGGSLCSESMAAITSCVAKTCPETTVAGGVNCDGIPPDADTCEDVQSMCNAYANCCGGCAAEIAGLLNQCTPGDGGTCAIKTCGAEGDQPKDQPPPGTSSSKIFQPAAGLIVLSIVAAMTICL